MRKFTLFLITAFLAFGYNGWGQTTIDFETEGSGYTPSATEGSGYTDVFNRTNPNIGGNSTYMWSVEDLTLTDPYITLDQIDISGATSFTFSIDMISHHYNDWDNTDELKITYSIDGGAYQNLMWVESITDPANSSNEPAALDPNFDGSGECAYVLPALSTGTGAGGCVVSSSVFETFVTSAIAVSGSTLDITLQFIGLTSSDEGIYLDNIVISPSGGSAVAPSVATVAATNIGVTSTNMNGNVTSDGGETVIARGVCYKTSSGVIISDNQTSAATAGTGTYSVNVATLSAETHYYFAAYATNSVGTTLASNELNFWTLATEPTGHSITFTATTFSPTQIDLAFDAASGLTADGYIILRREDSVDPDATDVTDATAPGSLSLPSGTSLVTTITDNSATSYSDAGLTSVTQYNYAIIPYNYNGANDETYNYKTDGTIPTDNATTTAKLAPTNHVDSFTASTPSSSTILLTWLDNDGVVVADGFIIKASTNSTFADPVNGTPLDDDTDMSDGSGQINVEHGIQAYRFRGLTENTQYFFKIWSYTNSGASIVYKMDGTIPTANETTIIPNLDLIISEVTDPNDHWEGRYVEIYNLGTSAIDFSTETWYLSRQAGGASWGSIQLTASIASGGKYVVGYSDVNFSGQYGFSADLYSGVITGNGDDGYFLYFGGDNSTGTLIDAYGAIDVDGSGEPWEYLDTKAVRLRSVTSPNTTWTASEWNIPSSADVADMTPSEYRENVTWQGTTDNSWNTKGNNWSGTYGFIPDASFNVTIPSTGITNYPTISSSSEAACNNLTIESSSSGDGSLLGQGNLTASGTVTAQRYISNGQWHGVSSPLDGATAQSLYSSTANVYLKEHTESTNAYTNITSLGTDLGDMKGLMMWYAGSAGETFDITGTLRTGTVGSADNLVRTIDGNANGWNFMGNPFPSAIDWDAGTGWLKTNVGISVYLYNNGTWNSWNGSTGTGMTSGNIAMGQGFFVEVIDGQTTGTLTMTDAVQVHNNVGFLKSKSAIEELIRLEVSNGTNTDETVVYFDNDATSGYDYQFDAHKLFSFDQDRPQIYSTANDNMSINVLPDENTDVPFDVKGLDGENMTIAATEVVGFGNLMLLDNATGSQTNLVMENYEFTYSEDISDRFLLFFTTVNTEEELESNCEIYSFDRNIRVILHNQRDAEIVIYNLMGQKINQTTAQSDITDITMYETGCYVVKVISHNNVETSKVIIR